MSARPDPALWFARRRARVAPLVDLALFPNAGAGASAFRDWMAAAPPWVDVLALRPPGREERIDEAQATSLSALAEAAAEALLAARARAPERPLAFAGHSYGAALAYETAAALAARGARGPGFLMLTATRAPRAPGAFDGALDAPGEAELRALLIGFDPRNGDLLAEPDLADALMPALKADIAALRAYAPPADRPPLGAAVTVLSGGEDEAAPAAHAAGWAARFRAPPIFETLPGDHFFPFRRSRDAALARLEAGLEALAGAV